MQTKLTAEALNYLLPVGLDTPPQRTNSDMHQNRSAYLLVLDVYVCNTVYVCVGVYTMSYTTLICGHTRMDVCACVRVCMYVCMYIYVCTHVCLHRRMCKHMFIISKYVLRMCGRIYIYTYRKQSGRVPVRWYTHWILSLQI